MAENKRFRFSDAEGIPDGPLFQEDRNNRRIERLSRMVMVILVLLPCLFGLMVYYGYRELSGRMNRSQDSGVQEAQKLSEEVQIKFNEISAVLDKLEAGRADIDRSIEQVRTLMEEKITAAASANDSLTTAAKANTDSVKRLNAALEKLASAKLDKAALGDIDARYQAALEPLSKEVETLGSLREEVAALGPLREEIATLSEFRQEIRAVSERLSALEDSLGEDLNAFATYVEKTNKDLVQIQSSITALSKDKISQDNLRLELLKAGKTNRLALLREITKIQKSLNLIQDRIYKLERTPPRSSIIRPPARSQSQYKLSQSGEVSEQELTD